MSQVHGRPQTIKQVRIVNKFTVLYNKYQIIPADRHSPVEHAIAQIFYRY